ncbi:MAG: hypothetical protein HKP48_00655 [Winogradskyella sp.]|uniref:hypothetical protein n=1 Tax=Winogradskyella sp. TaxID=1883156 RepID=UPI00185BA7DD|nr:hypothetical protein [Winogradskyella sp.]MBT8244868.1 hypothetical protein [Winogradskyella sp.]NNK21826.1 hypothetical protein [Winogradskyella sp.]
MDELELLKKDWQSNRTEYPELSYDEIYKMSHAKSSSIVKWIFYIGLIEFAFWFVISFVLKAFGYGEEIKSLESSNVFIVLAVVSYIVLFYFLYRFYMNYKNISTTDSARKLMKNILKTRKTVKAYVIFNLGFLVIATFYGVYFSLQNEDASKSMIDAAAANGEIFKLYASIIGATLLLLAFSIGILLLFYWLIYGLLLKQLNRNYKELKKLEV